MTTSDECMYSQNIFSLKVRDKHHDDNLMKLGVSYLLIRKFRYYLTKMTRESTFKRLFQKYFSSLSATSKNSTSSLSKTSQLPINTILFGSQYTSFESENESQKIEPVPIPLPRASKNFHDVKTRNEKKFYNWTSEIIPFICFGKQMDRT
jgi:hypothetical protein